MMEFNPSEILQLAESIWSLTLGLTIKSDASAAAPAPDRSTAACVQIIGAWNGAVVLDCPAQVARKAASIMFQTDVACVTLTDVQDAVAELVNMFGGNIKGLLPPTCHLSLPAVVEGSDYSARVIGSQLINRVRFLSEGQPVSLSIFEKVMEQPIAA